jgi:ABC-type multidrug transport system ATPase subunit
MKACRHCKADNADDYKFCHKCGRPFTDVPPPDATELWRGGGKPGEPIPPGVFTRKGAEPHRALPLTELFGTRDRLLIGRSPSCDLCLPHPSVSRNHALLERLPHGLRVHDLRSINGVRVGGRRITEPVVVREQERIGIGPYLFCVAGGVLHALDSSQSLRLEARSLEKQIALGGGRTRKLLENVNLAVEPGEFVALLGPSGSGKSTLMDCLNGRRPATRGRVLANGEDFYLHFNSFRQLLGYVPQRDIVHTQLTVYRALYYTARLRLPADTGRDELKGRIDEVVRLMELGPHQETLVGNLSGGQIKRVSLGAELIARPALLYIDEATSGLDAGTEARMMRLFQQLSREGKSVVCITHNVDHVDLCDLIVVLSGGRLAYCGPPAEGRAYFHVGRVSDIYDRLAERPPDEWEKEFEKCSLHEEFVRKRLSSTPTGSVLGPAPPAPTPAAATPPPAAPKAPASERPLRQFGHQFLVLTARYVEILRRDYRTLRLLLLQAPLVAALLFVSFMGKGFQYEVLTARSLDEDERAAAGQVIAKLQELPDKTESLQSALKRLPANVAEAKPVQQLLARLPLTRLTVADILKRSDMLLRGSMPLIPEKFILDPTYTYILVCLIVISILWFGCNNSAREIVKEEAVYGRERAVNLGIVPYLASKFFVLSVIAAVQVALTMLVIYGGMELMHALAGSDIPEPIYRLDYLAQYGVLVLLAMTGVALGLLLSACVSSPDRASTLLPYVLIPQIVLCGGILPVESGLLYVGAVVASPAYWGYRAVRTGETSLPPDFPWYANYDDSLWLPCAALALQTLALLALTAWFLRRKDRVKG